MDGSGLGENDPYRGMGSGEDEIRPGFLRGVRDWADGAAYRLNGENYDKNGKKLKSKKNKAGGDLASAEKSAAGGLSNFGKGLGGVRERESTAPGGIVNSVKGKAPVGKGVTGKNKAKGIFKKAGPMAAIGGVFAVVAMLMSGAQSMMPIAIEEMIIEKFNSVGISSTMASDAWLDVQLNQGVRMENIKKGDQENLFAFSEYQVKQFESQGIKVVDGIGSDSTSITALLYQKDGQWIPVVGSDILKYEGYSEADLINAIKSASGLDNIGSPVSPKEALADQAFKTPYTTASKAWRGGASGWFDNIMSSITETKLSITRNRWAKYVKKTAKGLTDEFKKIAKSANLEKTSDGGMDADVMTKKSEDADPTPEPIDNVNIEEGSGEDIKIEETVDVKNNEVKNTEDVVQIEGSLKGKALKAAAAVGDVASYGCALLEGVMSIYSLVSAYQSLQFLNLISGFLESVDKVKAGDDDSSPIHEYSTNLTTKADTMYNGEKVQGREQKTAMESAGMSWLFGNKSVVNSDDPSVKNVNFENIMSTTSDLFKDIGNKVKIYEQCGYIKAGAAVADLAATVISFIPIFGGAVKLGQVTFKTVAKAAVNVAVQVALYAIIPIAAKNLAKMMIKDAATEWFGEDLGNAIISGANKYVAGGNGTSGGQSPGGEQEVMSYLGARDVVIAEEGEYQRSIRDPFDITSRHTFLGSLAYSIIPLAYSGGIMTNLADISSLVSSSAIAMLPTASAIDTNSALNSKGSCDLLGSTGAVGDAFCNPYIITDVSTMNTSPIAVNDIVHNIHGEDVLAATSVYENVGSDNFEENGSIKKDSNLAKYITYCGQRTSQYGIKDATIASQLTGENSTASKIIGFVPVLNNIQDIVQGISDEVNMGWANGSACVASSENGHWDEYKWYQRYAENQRLLENMNPGYVSEVTAYLDDYYTVNPLDQSLEGTLARFTGMSKEKVEDTFALIEYFEFLDNYDPAERYAFGEPAVEAEKELKFDNENTVADNLLVILFNPISYADVRNRSFAA